MRALFLLLILTMLAGCSSDNNDFVVGGVTPSPSVFPSAAASTAPGASPEDHGPLAQVQAHRKIIQNAALTLRVPRVGEALEQAREATAKLGGFIANSASNEGTEATLEMKVPCAQMDLILKQLSALGVTQSRTESGQDVTDQAFDMENRLRNLAAEEKRIRDILSRTGEIKDVLEVERELTRVRGEIEQLQGGLNHLNDQAAYSTVTLKLIGPTVVVKLEAPDYWDLSPTIGNAWNMVKWVTRTMLQAAIYAAALLPFSLPFVLWISKSQRRQSPTGPSTSAPDHPVASAPAGQP